MDWIKLWKMFANVMNGSRIMNRGISSSSIQWFRIMKCHRTTHIKRQPEMRIENINKCKCCIYFHTWIISLRRMWIKNNKTEHCDCCNKMRAHKFNSSPFSSCVFSGKTLTKNRNVELHTAVDECECWEWSEDKNEKCENNANEIKMMITQTFNPQIWSNSWNRLSKCVRVYAFYRWNSINKIYCTWWMRYNTRNWTQATLSMCKVWGLCRPSLSLSHTDAH